MRPRYEALEHTADVGIIAYGATLEELFENAAYGMFDLMFALSDLHAQRDVPLVAAGDTPEELLVDWLNELLFRAEDLEMAFSYFAVDRLEEGGLKGSAGGAPVEGVPPRGAPIKAVTYHDLAVVEIPGGWWARIIFDV